MKTRQADCLFGCQSSRPSTRPPHHWVINCSSLPETPLTVRVAVFLHLPSHEGLDQTATSTGLHAAVPRCWSCRDRREDRRSRDICLEQTGTVYALTMVAMF